MEPRQPLTLHDAPRAVTRPFFYLAYSAYGVCGSSGLIAGVQDLLNADCVGACFGAVQELELELCFETASESARNADYREWLASLPKSRWSAKSAMLKVHHRVECLDLAVGQGASLTCTNLRGVLDELARAIERLRPRLAKRRILDFDAVTGLLIEARARWPEEQSAIAQLLSSARDVLARLPRDPWAGIETDWAHPAARGLLDDPFFWSPTEEFGPIGNDTGADVLADYRRWARRHPPEEGMRMIARLLQEWGIEAVSDVGNEALIALAFAQIMVHARVEPAVRAAAVTAIARRREAASDVVAPEHVAALVAALDKLAFALDAA